MKQIIKIKEAIRSAAISVGLCTRKSAISIEEYIKLIAELEGCFRNGIFPALPECNGRSKLMAQLRGTNVSEAFYIVNYLHSSLQLAGDICEFGIAQGATSALMANEIRNTSKNLWLFDSFQGLPKPSIKDQLIDDIFSLGSIENYQGTMACSIQEVTNRLKNVSFPPSRVKVVPGFIEETSKNTNLPEQVCFAYIDFDFYEPIQITLNLLANRMSNGSTIIVDDYNFFSSGVKLAVDEFIESSAGRFKKTLPLNFAGRFCILNCLS